MKLPYYLSSKLAALGLDEHLLLKNGYLATFQQLRLANPSLTYQVLFNLYCVEKQISFTELDAAMQQALIAEYKGLPPRYKTLSAKKLDYYMHEALKQAEIAYDHDEIPIGAVIVANDEIIGLGYNQTRHKCDILAHAETMAICQAQHYLENYRLSNCDLFVTIEPCLMCSGAIINSRIQRVFFGALEPKTGAVASQYQVFDNYRVNHQTQAVGPIDNDKYGKLISDFFAKLKVPNGN